MLCSAFSLRSACIGRSAQKAGLLIPMVFFLHDDELRKFSLSDINDMEMNKNKGTIRYEDVNYRKNTEGKWKMI